MVQRDYQINAENDIFKEWETNDYVMYVLATGGGKTVIFTDIIKKLIANGQPVLLIAHRTELITQAWTTLYFSGITAGIIMNTYQETPERLVQICSIQTLARRKQMPPASYIIIDEGHHAQPDNSYGKLLGMFSDAKVLLVTASPYRLSGEGFEYIHKYKKTRLIIGPDLAELTENGWLVPLDYYVVSVPDLDNIQLNKGDYEEKASKKAMELAPLVESYFMYAKGKQGVVFAVNVDHSKSIVAQYNEAGIPAAHLDANTPNKSYLDADGKLVMGRDDILADFKAKIIQVIVNVGIITEGYDFPDLEFVQLACPTKSLSKVKQMIGRVTRPLKGIVDMSMSPADRRNRIKQSRKPAGIVLDNAGCYIDHGLPDQKIDWEYYFKGSKRNKVVDGTMDILIFVAEDKRGNIVRTTNPKEVEGLKLVKIDREERKKIISLKCLKEFDAIYAKLKRLPKVKKPGITTVTTFVDWCERNCILIPELVWQYMEKVLISDIQRKQENLEALRLREFETYPDHAYATELIKIKSQGVSTQWLYIEKQKYFKKYGAALEKVQLKTA